MMAVDSLVQPAPQRQGRPYGWYGSLFDNNDGHRA